MKAILVEEIRLSEKSAALLIEEHGEIYVRRRAMYCVWMMDQGKVHVPSAWLTELSLLFLREGWEPLTCDGD
jgi:hypothetical protein